MVNGNPQLCEISSKMLMFTSSLLIHIQLIHTIYQCSQYLTLQILNYVIQIQLLKFNMSYLLLP